MPEIKIGRVSHFFDKANAAVIKLESYLKVGDIVKIRGAVTNFTQFITSMQIDRKDVKEAGPDDEIGIKVNEKCRPDDDVFKVIEE